MSLKRARSSRHQPQRTEKDEKEKLRIEAANKRKGRAERRRGDGTSSEQVPPEGNSTDRPRSDPEPAEDLPLAISRTQTKDSEEPTPPEETPVPPQPTPGTPPTSHPAASASHKRVARSHHKKSKGKNQYTKDRDVDREESPARSMSRDIPHKNADEYHVTVPSTKIATHDSRNASSSKAKTPMANKMSMLDMKRRVAAIMDFISRTQVDLAAEGSIASSSNSNSGGGSPQKSTAQPEASEKTAEADSPTGIVTSTSEFRDLSCVEMMDVLTRDMVKWQNHYT